MKVLLFHPTHLPPRDYGGVERVVLWLAKGLVEQGHEVWVGAFPGSVLPKGAHLLPIDPDHPSAERLVGRLPPGLDVVHFMAPPEAGVTERLGCASLLTVHGNGREGEVFPLNTVFLSADHARRHGGEVFVHNGIDPDEVEFDPSLKEDRYLFLSKTSWSVKNLVGAMRLCKRAGAGLRIAGGSRPWLTRLQAALTPGVSWEGPVAGARKARLLAQAKALVFPVLWPEPFGLVVVEALMSGTPVLAPPRGSLPELVSSQVGAILRSDEEWIEMLSRPILPWDPEDCRKWALDKFHYRGMATRYAELYQKVAGGGALHERAPIGRDWRKSP